jgi:hypothetical protein
MHVSSFDLARQNLKPERLRKGRRRAFYPFLTARISRSEGFPRDSRASIEGLGRRVTIRRMGCHVRGPECRNGARRLQERKTARLPARTRGSHGAAPCTDERESDPRRSPSSFLDAGLARRQGPPR